MSYKLLPDKKFVRHYAKLPRELQRQVDAKLILLAGNPHHPSLRTKHIQGTEKLFECSVNMDVRIVWHYEGDALILLLEIGHHGILDQF
jgi:mRNA-degrading endonuclease YafQ of YafQ-DinJ toxin-antitoxin module